VENQPLLPITRESIEKALAAVATSVFPHRALEIQRLWMNRAMRKPYDLSTRKTAAAITRLNNCLPLFPGGSAASKFSEVELVGLLEWSLPPAWRSQFDLKGYVPTLDTKSRLISECEAIERNETETKTKKNEDNNNKTKNNKKSKSAKAETENKKNGAASKNNAFFCKECGRNRTHATEDCYILKNKAKRAQANAQTDADTKPTAKPFSKRTFRKEVNALACKASKKKVLALYEAALKREKAKEGKLAKKHAKPREELDSSDSEASMNILEKVQIPKKATIATPTSILKRRAVLVDYKKMIKEHNQKKAEKAAKTAILEEEAAFLCKITSDEPEVQILDSSSSANLSEDTEMYEKD
jgi:hypothetical protein